MTRCTTSGEIPTNPDDASVPTNEKRADGQYKDHWTMCPTEIMQAGLQRPIRTSYYHVGLERPSNLRDMTEDEHKQYDKFGYVKYEEYGPERAPICGKYWTQPELDRLGGCGTKTSMPRQIAETYAANPKYYGSTFCCGCGDYFRVDEFIWDDGTRVGS